MFPRILLGITIFGIGLGLLLGTPGTSAENTNSREAEIRKLSLERRDVLRQLLDASTQQYMGGIISYHEMLNAERLLLEVNVELATSKAERIAALESHLKNRRVLEKHVEERFAGGTISRIDVLAVTAQRLDVEIALLREAEKKE